MIKKLIFLVIELLIKTTGWLDDLRIRAFSRKHVLFTVLVYVCTSYFTLLASAISYAVIAFFVTFLVISSLKRDIILKYLIEKSWFIGIFFICKIKVFLFFFKLLLFLNIIAFIYIVIKSNDKYDAASKIFTYCNELVRNKQLMLKGVLKYLKDV